MSPHELNELTERARRVELLLMDVDGVLTDGRIWFVPSGDRLEEVKSFSVADGAGIALAHRAGLATGIISGRSSRIVVERARELDIDEVHIGIRDKSAALDAVARSRSISPDHMAFVGDDVVDLPAMRRVGLPVAVANASEDVKPHAAYVTSARGGEGAVREVIELILKAQGKWDSLVGEFLK
jgi:3-deoxy-D-manno-octulosonate 8-phosphate phosphatase (KDO 8-P phosphatase)